MILVEFRICMFLFICFVRGNWKLIILKDDETTYPPLSKDSREIIIHLPKTHTVAIIGTL